MARPIIDNAMMGNITGPPFKDQSNEHSIPPSDKKNRAMKIALF
jgi:hypothetical protein